MTPATEADRNWIEAHLHASILTSMFPLSNLAIHGWMSDAPRAMRFLIDQDRKAVLGITTDGMLMPQMNSGFEAVGSALAGRTVMGAAGATEQVRPLLKALGINDAPSKISDDEPQFLLSLGDLIIPEGPGHLAPASEAPRDLLEKWRADYLVETVSEDRDTARDTAREDAKRFLASGHLRILMVDRTPVCMTGLNAALPDIVQVGGVWTPPDLRGRGHARRAVALHLSECARQGVGQATLFASGPAAVRAYEAIGFSRIGLFSLVLFRRPCKIGA